jgi:flagellar protein FlaI
MKVLAKYDVVSEGVPAEITIMRKEEEFIDTYEVTHAKIKKPTRAVLDYLKGKIIESISVKTSEMLDPRESERVRLRIVDKAHELLKDEIKGLSDEEENILVGKLAQEMTGLGDLELLLADDNLEEVVVNSSHEPVYVYHKKFGWLKTNLTIPNEEMVSNYASIIGRKIGKQITNLAPLMDAHLLSGDRANATLFPISTKGNTLTIRKFAREPWTITHFISPEFNTLNAETAALLWLSVQYEMNLLITGGTASGKTSFLNAVLVFTPANQRIISIEDTRELMLPDFLHWTPMVTRAPNPEGKGGVDMLDLLVNSLRMRPDRIVLGEIRRQNEAEVLFEAMHTGHAVYSTLHADNAAQVKSRMISPPIALPEEMLGALQLMAVQYRQRRTGMRRTYEIAEIVPKENGADINVVYRWSPREDRLKKIGNYKRVFDDLTLHTGMTTNEINRDLKDKQRLLNYMLKHNVNRVNTVGRLVAAYYRDPERVLKHASKNLNPEKLLS